VNGSPKCVLLQDFIQLILYSCSEHPLCQFCFSFRFFIRLYNYVLRPLFWIARLSAILTSLCITVLPLITISLKINLDPFIKILSHNKMYLHSLFTFVQTTLLSNFKYLLQKNNVMHPFKVSGHRCFSNFNKNNVNKQHKPACESNCIPCIFAKYNKHCF
jgi:hypothetical protein